MAIDPRTIGRYRVQHEIGSGAMGRVYLAEDPLLKRQVAIKVVHGGMAALRRFQREAQISAQLNHPNIITIHDVGEEPNLGPFLAMEYIDGPSLEEHLAKGPLSPEEALPLLVQALHALEAAHLAGIIHRDFKPANLLIDPAKRLKLMDFGIARQEDHEQTASGILCTPSYAAPEMLDGSPPSQATDQWAFAVTTFQCLTGHHPFQGSSLSEVLFSIAHGEPDLPRDMNGGLRETFLRAFAKDPAQRHAGLRAFLCEVLEHLEAGPSARPWRDYLETSGPGVPTQALPRPQRPRLRQIALLGLTAILAAALGLYFGLRPRRLSIASTPPGALLKAGGRALGRTPLASISIPRGTKSLQFELEGFLPLDQGLAPDMEDLTVSLQRAPAQVSVRSDPPQAKIYIDETFRGVTPAETLDIPGEGQYQLTLRKEGFEPWSMAVSRTQHPPVTIKLRQKPHRRRGFIQRLFQQTRRNP